jgi:hypothetical protein
LISIIGKFFLRAKAWQVFLIVLGSDFIGRVALTVTEVLRMSPRTPDYSILVAAVAAICGSGFVVWLWFLGAALNGVVIQASQRQSTRSLSASVLVIISFIVVSVTPLRSPRALSPWALSITVPLGLVLVVLALYTVDFVAVSLLLAETGRIPTFGEYVKPFFLLLFFPLGIWFIQPRLNRLYKTGPR